MGGRLCYAVMGFAALVAGVGACSRATASTAPGVVSVVAAENEYGDVAAQIGGQWVRVESVMSDPNTDPHSYELSSSVVEEVASAQLIVQNGVGYDTFMDKIEESTSGRARVIVAAKILGVPSDAPNPHLWYDPRTMPAVAAAIAGQLEKMEPAHAAAFRSALASFDRSLAPWVTALRDFPPAFPVAVTEPVADYMLSAAGARILTPFALQAAVMNGVDPAPQDLSDEVSLLRSHRVEAIVYNEQVTDPVTSSFLTDARAARVPVVAVYETMPAGFHYQGWMEAETAALLAAVTKHTSTEHL